MILVLLDLRAFRVRLVLPETLALSDLLVLRGSRV